MEDVDQVYTIREVADHWGNKMPMMAMEEAGEFIHAVSKYERERSEEAREHLIEEIADMMIGIDALRVRYDIRLSDVGAAMNKKLAKTY